MVKYEYVKNIMSDKLTNESRKRSEKIIDAVDLLMKIIIIDGNDK